MLIEVQGSLLLALAVSLGFFALAFRWGFFRIVHQELTPALVGGRDVAIMFLLTAVWLFLVGPSIVSLIFVYVLGIPSSEFLINPMLLTAFRFATMGGLVFVIWARLATTDTARRRAILTGGRAMTFERALGDMGTALAVWFLSIGVLELGVQVILWLIQLVTTLPEFQQVAVEQLDTSSASPWLFAVNLIGVLILAPIYEETLFRGYLQSWLSNRFGLAFGIPVTSLAFAGAHYAPSQGMGNIILLANLFGLSCFLGWIYEKRQSLLAAITLHAFFNLFSLLAMRAFGG